MKHTDYWKWLQENLNPSSVIIVANVSYHSTKKTPYNRLSSDKHSMQYHSTMSRVKLYNLIRIHKAQYEI
jgi:hypothetical protein